MQRSPLMFAKADFRASRHSPNDALQAEREMLSELAQKLQIGAAPASDVRRGTRSSVGTLLLALLLLLSRNRAEAQIWDTNWGSVELRSSGGIIYACGQPSCSAGWNLAEDLFSTDNWIGRVDVSALSPLPTSCPACFEQPPTSYALSMHGSMGHTVSVGADAWGCEITNAVSATASLRLTTENVSTLVGRVWGTLAGPLPNLGSCCRDASDPPTEPCCFERVAFAHITLRRVTAPQWEFHIGTPAIGPETRERIRMEPGTYEVSFNCHTSPFYCADFWLADGYASAQIKLLSPDLLCEQDLDGDTAVTTADLALLLLDWGDCPSCQSDLNWDLRVDGADLSELLLSFGPCQ